MFIPYENNGSSQRKCLVYSDIPLRVNALIIMEPGTTCVTHKGSVINYWEGDGLQDGKIVGPKLSAATLPQDRVIFSTLPVKRVEHFCTPLSVWLKLKGNQHAA